MESQAPKVELKEIGLDVGLAVARHFYKTEYLHYGFWPPELSVEPANVLQAQENYANLLLETIPKGVKRILDVGCGSGKFAQKMIEHGYEVDCVSPSPYLTNYARGLLGPDVTIFECRYADLKTDRKYDLVLCSESFQYLHLIGSRQHQRNCSFSGSDGQPAPRGDSTNLECRCLLYP